MNTASSLLTDLKAAGFSIRIDAGKLVVRGKRGAVIKEMHRALKEKESELLQIIKQGGLNHTVSPALNYQASEVKDETDRDTAGTTHGEDRSADSYVQVDIGAIAES